MKSWDLPTILRNVNFPVVKISTVHPNFYKFHFLLQNKHLVEKRERKATEFILFPEEKFKVNRVWSGKSSFTLLIEAIKFQLHGVRINVVLFTTDNINSPLFKVFFSPLKFSKSLDNIDNHKIKYDTIPVNLHLPHGRRNDIKVD